MSSRRRLTAMRPVPPSGGTVIAVPADLEATPPPGAHSAPWRAHARRQSKSACTNFAVLRRRVWPGQTHFLSRVTCLFVLPSAVSRPASSGRLFPHTKLKKAGHGPALLTLLFL